MSRDCGGYRVISITSSIHILYFNSKSKHYHEKILIILRNQLLKG